MSGRSEVVTDPLFVGMTCPPLMISLTLSFFVLNLTAAAILFLALNNFLGLLVALPIHGLGMLACARDPRFFDLELLHFQRCPPVRRGVLKPHAEFDPADYVLRDFKRYARMWFIGTGALVSLNLLFLYMERMDYDLLTEGHIVYTDYWTTEAHPVGYGDVNRVEVACLYDEQDGFILSYTLNVGKDESIRAINLDEAEDFQTILPERLDAWQRVDAKLRAAGVPVRHAVKQTKQRNETRFIESDCRAGLDRRLGEAARQKVMPLLRENEEGSVAGK